MGPQELGKALAALPTRDVCTVLNIWADLAIDSGHYSYAVNMSLSDKAITLLANIVTPHVEDEEKEE